MPSGTGALGFAGLHSDWGLAAVGGECRLGRVALAAITDLGEHRCGGDRPRWGL